MICRRLVGLHRGDPLPGGAGYHLLPHLLLDRAVPDGNGCEALRQPRRAAAWSRRRRMGWGQQQLPASRLCFVPRYSSPSIHPAPIPTPAGPFFMYTVASFLSLMLYTSFSHAVLYFSPNAQVGCAAGRAVRQDRLVHAACRTCSLDLSGATPRAGGRSDAAPARCLMLAAPPARMPPPLMPAASPCSCAGCPEPGRHHTRSAGHLQGWVQAETVVLQLRRASCPLGLQPLGRSSRARSQQLVLSRTSALPRVSPQALCCHATRWGGGGAGPGTSPPPPGCLTPSSPTSWAAARW